MDDDFSQGGGGERLISPLKADPRAAVHWTQKENLGRSFGVSSFKFEVPQRRLGAEDEKGPHQGGPLIHSVKFARGYLPE